MTPEPLRAGIYCRISLARFGDTVKVEDQERICRALCEQRGWVAGEVYRDENKSAWQHNRKRPGWDRMLADVEAGKLDAIVVYHGDQLIRQPWDLEVLLRLARGKGVKLASPTGTRDLGSDEDQFILGIEANMARRESANTSRRKKNQYERMRRAGLVRSGGRGGRVFGFASDGVTHVPGETAIVREVCGRVLAGEEIRTIASALAARGVRTTAGTLMHPIAIRRMITNPRYAGLMPDGEQAAAWEPVLSREQWEVASVILAARSGPMPPGHTARRHLLSGIAMCGACGAPLRARPAYAGRNGRQVAATYGCATDSGCRKVYRSQALLDAYVSRRTVNRLSHPANPPGAASHPDFGREFQQLATERAATEATVKNYRTSPGRVELLMSRLGTIDTRLAELRELATASNRARIMETHAGITAAEFGALPLGSRRALIAACYVVRVLPASKRGPGFRTEDVELTPR